MDGTSVLVAVSAVDPIPADPPVGGPLWTLVVPALLFLVAFAATYLLYRRFSRPE